MAKDLLTREETMQSHMEFLHKRLKVIFNSNLFRKIFSATFYALIVLIQNDGLSYYQDP